ncbi:MAG: hypothetical protein IKJ74_01115 [Clostridia bacterium]|nr:hypothetical protein [Clostridia bacterium]
MWIELRDDLIDAFDTNTKSTDRIARSINALFTSMYDQYHIVYANQDLLEKLRSMPFVHQDNQVLITWILNKYISVYECHDAVKKKIIVVPDGVQETNTNNIYYIAISELQKIRQSMLLTENKTDYDLFNLIFSFLKPFGKNYVISLENNPFYGGNVSASVQIVESSSRFALCIVDSDKDYETSCQGNTCNSAVRSIDRAKEHNCVIDLHILGVREKENLIPLIFYSTTSSEKEVFYNCVRKFEENVGFMKFVDYKGIKQKKINSANTEWSSLYMPFVEECKKSGIFLEQEDEKELCVKGINDHQLEMATQAYFEDSYVQLTKKQKDDVLMIKTDIKLHIPRYIMEEWNSISAEMFDYGCSLSDQFMRTLV